uniref:HIPK2 n=1 Tax=Poeciliopsis prolifica TaxID=188132 RepID=A0A0S7EPX9_9TELE
MKGRFFKPLSVSAIRLIAQQMLVALQALKSIAMVHTDIKPDNIMFVNHKSIPFKLKLIDFGMAKHVSELRTGTWVQPDCYRAFEVLLGLPLSVSMDMWSLGCTLAFCYLGRLLFPSYSQYENMKTFVELWGKPDNSLLNQGLFTSNFFNLVQRSPKTIWEFKNSTEYVKTSKDVVKEGRSSSNFIQSFYDLDTVQTCKDINEWKDIKAFIRLLKRMIVLDPDKRISPSEALRLNFITMNHLVGCSGKYLTKAQKMMRKCQLQPIPEELR